MSAGVGIVGLAHYMAQRKLKYSSQEGKEEMHRVAERHAYIAIEQSLRLGKELGNAPWMHRTKWPQGWLPIDTYNRSVDQIVAPVYQYDWEDLRRRVIENGGIRNSVLIAHMPSESSSKASGTTNGLYPIRDLTLLKTDNNIVVYWAAPEGEKLADNYEIAWKIPTYDMIDCYALFQKFTDQGISVDTYIELIGDAVVTTKEMLSIFAYKTKRGLKGTYYTNTKTSAGSNLEAGEAAYNIDPNSAGCAGGFCSL
jgi:ribonucleoside-diphosphate reductase alpha chain